jgi:hypothetical protein
MVLLTKDFFVERAPADWHSDIAYTLDTDDPGLNPAWALWACKINDVKWCKLPLKMIVCYLNWHLKSPEFGHQKIAFCCCGIYSQCECKKPQSRLILRSRTEQNNLHPHGTPTDRVTTHLDWTNAAPQGCQTFPGTTYQNGKNVPNEHKIYQMTTKYTKWPQNIPIDHKIYQLTTKYTYWPQNLPNFSKIDHIAIKYTNIFRCKTLQNLSKLGFF